METQFKIFNERLIERERLISQSADKIGEGNKTI